MVAVAVVVGPLACVGSDPVTSDRIAEVRQLYIDTLKNWPLDKVPAAAIYRRDYWNRVKGDQLPDGIDLVAFDPAVNSGVSRGSRTTATRAA